MFEQLLGGVHIARHEHSVDDVIDQTFSRLVIFIYHSCDSVYKFIV